MLESGDQSTHQSQLFHIDRCDKRNIDGFFSWRADAQGRQNVSFFNRSGNGTLIVYGNFHFPAGFFMKGQFQFIFDNQLNRRLLAEPDLRFLDDFTRT